MTINQGRFRDKVAVLFHASLHRKKDKNHDPFFPFCEICNYMSPRYVTDGINAFYQIMV